MPVQLYVEKQAYTLYLVECSLKEDVEGRLEQLREILLLVTSPRVSCRVVAYGGRKVALSPAHGSLSKPHNSLVPRPSTHALKKIE